ncbi:MAG: TIR domain-containing protein [Planctomycetota bacterium]
MEWGDDWHESLRDAVCTARSLLCLISPSFLKSEWCGREYHVFSERREESSRQRSLAAGCRARTNCSCSLSFVRFLCLWSLTTRRWRRSKPGDVTFQRRQTVSAESPWY